jgi:hypothetical protein
MSKAGRKIMANLKKEYGDKKGKGIFYAMENEGEIPGMNKMKGYAKGGDTKKKKDSTTTDPALAYIRALESGETDERYLETLRRLAIASTEPEKLKPGMAKGGMAKKEGYQVGGQVPTQQQAAQARRAAVGRQTPSATTINQLNMAMAQSRQAAASNRMTTSPSQMQAAQDQQARMSQARRVAASQQKPADTATNQRNMAMAQSRQAAANQKAAQGTNMSRFTGQAGSAQKQVISEQMREQQVAAQRANAANQKAAPKARRNPFSRSGMAKGGMVKTTGKMNTGIKKCGE